jgi:hypothetical protein
MNACIQDNIIKIFKVIIKRLKNRNSALFETEVVDGTVSETAANPKSLIGREARQVCYVG